MWEFEGMGGTTGATVWHLPGEVLVLIFSFLPVEDIGRAARVCSWWSRVAEDRRVWRGKSFLSVDGHGLSDVLPVARALPVLKTVSICWGRCPNVYLSGELAIFKVPSLRDVAVTSVISALVTVNLSVDFLLLEKRSSNCLVVQLHELKHLKICATHALPQDTSAKLRALGDMLSCEPLSKLQSVDIHTDTFSRGPLRNLLSEDTCTNNFRFIVDRSAHSDILGALSTCTALERLTIRSHCTLSRHTVTEFSKLQVLRLQDCIIPDISFLDLCPNLHSLWLGNCSLPGWHLPSRVAEMRSLTLGRLNVTTEFVDMLCSASPKLESITLDNCPNVVHTPFLSHCPQLRILEVNRCGTMSSRIVGLPSGLQHLRLDVPHLTSDTLAEILQGVPRLEILDVRCRIESLRFLRHCRDLTELSLPCTDTFQDFYELGGLRHLRKLRVSYHDADVGPLANALCKMPQLELLTVVFMNTVSNLSFLRYCHRLHSLSLSFLFLADGERLSFHELSDLKELRQLVLYYRYLGVEDLVAFLPSLPHLKALDINFVNTECNLSFLRHCGRLTSLAISCYSEHVSHLTQL